MSGPPAPTLPLDRYLAAERAAVERALSSLLEELLQDAPRLAEAVRYAVAAGGKRLRPILCVGAYRAVGSRAPGEGAYRLGAAVELVHCYSLVHDDLPCMDDDDLRRGRPATHRAFGEAVAVLAGAALIPMAARAVVGAGRWLGLSDLEVGRLVLELTRAAGIEGMVGGQLLDLEAEASDLDLEALEAVHAAKTGALITGSLRLGALAAGADAPTLEALTTYGRALGLAFQITDDVLDATADPAILGKPSGSDAALDKATFPAVLGLDGARERARGEAERAVAALRAGDIESPELEGLAAYAVERER